MTATPDDVLEISLNEAVRARIGANCPETVALRLDKMPLPHALILKKATGQTLMTLVRGLEEFEPEALAAIIWFSLYLAGVRITFEMLCGIDELDLMEIFGDDEPVVEPVDPTGPSASSPKKKSVK
jgi:hypothetical protein